MKKDNNFSVFTKKERSKLFYNSLSEISIGMHN